MKIQNIQQNNNTNFQGLYGSKRALAQVYLSPLKSEIKDLAKNYDVLVKTSDCKYLADFMSSGLGMLSSMLTFMGTFSLPATILAGVGTFLTSACLFLKGMNFSAKIGEKVVKDNNSGKWILTGLQDNFIFLDGKEVENKNTLESLENDFLGVVLDRGSANLIKKHLESGRLNLFARNAEYLQARFSAKEYQEIVDTLAKEQLTQDKYGNLPLHYCDEIYKLRELNNYLKNDIKDLSTIYLTRNNKGELPIHNPNIMQNQEALQNIMGTFENYPRLLITIFEAKNQQGKSALDVLRKTQTQTADNIVHRLAEVKNDYIKQHGLFTPVMLGNNENKNTEVNFQSIMKMLKDNNILSHKYDFIQNVGITKIIDFTINNASKDEEKSIIQELQKLPNIDYNEVDSNGISVIEKIINSENPDLLDLVKDTEFDYSRELDYAYDRIDDKNFKEKVKNLNIYFPNIEQACRPYSTKRLHDYSELKSPFFNITKILNHLSGEIIMDLTNPDDQIKQLLLLNAQHIIQKHSKGNLFEPIQFLEIINDDEIKQYYKNGNFFNYKLEDNSDDTLLTKFLDIVPTEENQKDYQEIIKFLKNAKYIDYNQTDSNGISVIEKIINSENPDLLDLIKDFGFDYSRELDYAYDRIDDKNFKNKVKNLNIYFPNIEQACCLNSIKALEKLLTELKSPFFNTNRLVNYLYWSYGIETVDIYDAIRFFGKNGINITDMSIDITDKWKIDALNRRRHFALLSQ